MRSILEPGMRKGLLCGLFATLFLPRTLDAQDTAATSQRLTYTEDIAPILFSRCVECHRPGQSAPFSLLTYADTKRRARMIAFVTETGFMPPWHPEQGWGEFKDARRLTNEEIAILSLWAEQGAVQGPSDAMPPVPEFVDKWRLGEPDLILEMPDAYPVPAQGPDIYRNFVLPLNLQEDQWVTGVEVLPSSPSVVHHALYFLDDSGHARKMDSVDGQPGFYGMGWQRSGWLGGWAVGATPRHLPLNLAYELPAGSDFVIQTHFHPSGKKEWEKSLIGLHLADEPPANSYTVFQLPPAYGALSDLDIPAGTKNYRLHDGWVLPVDVQLLTIGGHAHYLCTSMQAKATLPDGKERKLFRIGEWDFNWQGRYEYQEPLFLPAGTYIDVEIYYDNSGNNPSNPFDPPRRTKWGLESTDEMGSILFGVIPVVPEELAVLKRGMKIHGEWVVNRRRPARARRWRSSGVRIKGYDANHDGQVEEHEVPLTSRPWFHRFDINRDGVLTAKEMEGWAKELSVKS